MKKINYILITFFAIIIPFLTVNASDDCESSRILEMQKALTNFSFSYEFVPEGTIIKGPAPYISDYDASNKIKVTMNGLPNNYYVIFESDGELQFQVEGNSESYIDGGVYNVRIRNYECGLQDIKKYEVFIPIYNDKTKKKEDTWHDGTYELKKDPEKDSNKTKINTVLIVVIVVLIVSIGVAFWFMFRKRKLQ